MPADCNWILPLIVSGACFGFADTLCDIVIHQEDTKKEGKAVAHYQEVHDTSISTVLSTSTSSSAAMVEERDSKDKKPKEIQELNSVQTIFICIVVTYSALFVYFFWIMWNHESYINSIQTQGLKSFLFQEKYDYKFYYALMGGSFSFLCYFYVLKAFESAPSTVILPLLQFPSIFVFVASSMHKYFLGLVWLETPLHIVAYIVIFMGGLIPATNGNLGMVTTKKFWKQPFVKDALLSELCHGLYNMCISTVEDDISTMDLYLEYFATTRIMFVLTFVIFLLFSKKWQDDVWKIRHVAAKPVWITVIAEVLTLTAYFCSAMAYQCYYQTGVVTAAESSLNQLLNLFSAFMLRRFFSLGREESAQGVGNKLLSAVLILIGLSLAA